MFTNVAPGLQWQCDFRKFWIHYREFENVITYLDFDNFHYIQAVAPEHMEAFLELICKSRTSCVI